MRVRNCAQFVPFSSSPVNIFLLNNFTRTAPNPWCSSEAEVQSYDSTATRLRALRNRLTTSEPDQAIIDDEAIAQPIPPKN